jgi:hypothetical protein
VRQCRLHFLYASRAAATELFSQKRLEFHLHFSPNDSTANTPYEELRLEASFSLDLSRLNFHSRALATGREKIDVLVPVETKTLGSIVAKISGNLSLSLLSLLSLSSVFCSNPSPLLSASASAVCPLSV